MFDFDISAYIASFLAIASIHAMAVVSPGPDVALTIRNSLLYSRKVGLAGALGTTTGMCIHLTYTVFGIGYIVSEVPWLMNLIRIAGAIYLVFLGYKSFKSKGMSMGEIGAGDGKTEGVQISSWQAYRIGVVNNLLNPMVILLFIGILSAYITSETPAVVQGLYGIMMVMITFSWFAFVALFFSIDKIRNQFLKLGTWLERITGGVLIAFGIKVALIVGRAF